MNTAMDHHAYIVAGLALLSRAIVTSRDATVYSGRMPSSIDSKGDRDKTTVSLWSISLLHGLPTLAYADLH